jgi:ABC-2 type transport system permease protein
MRLLKVIKKEILHLVHEPETITLMIIFPFLLTWVLGTALGGVMSGGTAELPETSIPIVTQGGMLSDMYIKEAGNAGIVFEKMSKEEVESGVESGDISDFVTMDSKSITLHSDNPNYLKALLVRTYSDVFAQQSNIIMTAMKEGKLSKAMQGSSMKSYVKSEGIHGNPMPGGMGYYSIAMLTMIMMYGAIQTIEIMHKESYENTDLRLKCSPYSMNRIFYAKIGVATIALVVQALILMLANTLAYSVSYRSIVAVLIALTPFAIFCCGLGLVVYQISGADIKMSRGILNTVIVLLVTFGGGYVPPESMGRTMRQIIPYTPVGMLNKGLIQYIYSNNAEILGKSAIINLVVGLAIIFVSNIIYRKREGISSVANS